MESRRANEHPARNFLAALWRQLEKEKDKPSVALVKSIQDGLVQAGAIIDQLTPIEAEERRLLDALQQVVEIKTIPTGRGKIKEWIEIKDRENYDFIIKRLIELGKRK